MSTTDVAKYRNQKQLRGSVSNYEISGKYSSPVVKTGPYISSYRLFRCPSAQCTKTLSPSTLLPHFVADHRELQPKELYPGTRVILELSSELNNFEDMDPNVIRLIQIKETTMNEVPLLVNACCLVDKNYANECSKNKFKQVRPSGQWVCLWLSSICNFNNWFSMRLFNKGTPQTSMTKICKPVLVQHPMTTIDILADLNVMVVEHSTISSISCKDDRLKIEVTMYEA